MRFSIGTLFAIILLAAAWTMASTPSDAMPITPMGHEAPLETMQNQSSIHKADYYYRRYNRPHYYQPYRRYVAPRYYYVPRYYVRPHYRPHYYYHY